MKELLVSVLMTAYNREEYIGKAIESVLASTYTDLELIIVDDCSSDNTVKIAKEYASKDSRIKVFVNEQNLGDYPNRNKAASYATGKYIKYLDSDDIIYPHGLEVMMRSMEQFPEAGFGLSSISDIERPYPVCLLPHDAYWEHFNGYGHFDRAPGSGIIKKEAFDAVGGFSGTRHIGDQELWFSIGRIFPLVKLQRDLVWDRTHKGQEKDIEKSSFKKYDQLRKELLKNSLAHPQIPLSEEEIKAVKKKSQQNRIKKLIRNAI